jgi:hypothetical protein
VRESSEKKAAYAAIQQARNLRDEYYGWHMSLLSAHHNVHPRALSEIRLPLLEAYQASKAELSRIEKELWAAQESYDAIPL